MEEKEIEILQNICVKTGHKSDWWEDRFNANNEETANIWLRGFLTQPNTAKAIWGEVLLCYDCGEKVKTPQTVMNGRVQIGTGDCYCSRQFENNIPAFEYHNAITANMKSNSGILEYIAKYL